MKPHHLPAYRLVLASLLLIAACGTPLPSQTGNAPNGPLSLRLPNDQTTKGNSPPFIQSLTSQPSQVQAGSTVTLKAQGFDVESQNLTYRWTASRGTLIKTSGAEVQWKAEENGQPLDAGFAIVSVVVDDGQQAVKGDINILLENTQGQAAVDPGSVTLVCTPTPPKEVASLVFDQKLSPVFYEVPNIATGRITIDGETNDWEGILPALQDAAQDHGGFGDDIRTVYLAQDNDFLYYRIDTWNPPQSQATGRHLSLGETGNFERDPYPQAEEKVGASIEGKIPRSSLVQHNTALNFYLTVIVPGASSMGDRTRPLGLINTAEVVRLRSSRTISSTSVPADYVNPVGMGFNNIPAGTFMMGKQPNSPIELFGIQPHSVTLSAFQIQTTELTIGQWEAVMGVGNFPSEIANSNTRRSKQHPVYHPSWCDIVGVEGDAEICAGYNNSFLKVLNTQGHGIYRLPTEAEWEYAARAGTTTDYACGDYVPFEGNENNCPYNMGWFGENIGTTDRPRAVAQKQPNAWGLYDMHGNVYEWVSDWHAHDYYQEAVGETSPRINPKGPTTGTSKVTRGDGWDRGAMSATSWSRDHAFEAIRRNAPFGFRLVREQ